MGAHECTELSWRCLVPVSPEVTDTERLDAIAAGYCVMQTWTLEDVPGAEWAEVWHATKFPGEPLQAPSLRDALTLAVLELRTLS